MELTMVAVVDLAVAAALVAASEAEVSAAGAQEVDFDV